jgi:hypothetical protein
VTCTGEKKNTSRVLVEKTEEGNPFRGLCRQGRIILKWDGHIICT